MKGLKRQCHHLRTHSAHIEKSSEIVVNRLDIPNKAKILAWNQKSTLKQTLTFYDIPVKATVLRSH